MQTGSLELTVLTSRRGFLISRFNEQTAILSLWGDLWHGTTRRRTYRSVAGREEQSRCRKCCNTRPAQSGHSHAPGLLFLGSFAAVDRADNRICNARKRCLLSDKNCPCAKDGELNGENSGRDSRGASMQGLQGPAPPGSGLLMTW
jgi:hypothetical protein